MAHLKFRRATALVLTLSLLPVSLANASPRTPAHPRALPSAGNGIVGWVTRTVIDAMAKSGIRIDPNGNH
ncbi:MAG TPA: hypothetical protein VIE43_07965 [Thermoanaerobaculia bacterium]|jgi:hypothetical protein|nr:hypothetical protein [Thermoanaerobaculia bacterium]